MTPEIATVDEKQAKLAFDGDAAEVFALAMKTGALTFLTLGIYRFWAKTRMRRYFWSRTRLNGQGFEYTGTGLEKFLGFLVAVVVLAVYLAIVQVILFLLGMRFTFRPTTEAEMLAQLALFYASALAVLPLVYFATYRSRRYRMSRSKFRGIRLGMASEAWAYTGRAVIYLVLAIVTLGILHPLMRFRLEKFMTDRTFYGDARLVQGGNWTGLYWSMRHIFIAVLILVLAVVATAITRGPGLGILFGIVGFAWLIVGLFSYYVQGFGYMTCCKRLETADGSRIAFAAAPQTGTVFKHYFLGGLAVGLAASTAFGFVGLLSQSLFDPSGQSSQIPVLVVGALGYVAALIVIGAVQLTLVTRPVIGHMITTITILDAEPLDTVRQRVGEGSADADGFAEALDVGGAF